MFCPPTILILFTNQSKAEEGKWMIIAQPFGTDVADLGVE